MEKLMQGDELSEEPKLEVAVVPGNEASKLQEDEEPVVPQLFWDGGAHLSILMRQAFKDLDFCWCLEDVTHIFDVPAFGLMARIKRYTEGRQLVYPEEINDEEHPFLAIKYAYCDDWEKFKKNKGRVQDLTHLRAYFWHEVDNNNDDLMCITHFKIKTKRTLDPEDTKISKDERSYFLRTNRFYSDENWD